MKGVSKFVFVAFLALLAVPFFEPPKAQAGPLARAGRALVSRRLDRRANASLPRQRIVQRYSAGGRGCANGSCGF